MYSRNADVRGHFGSLVATIPSIRAFVVNPHSIEISRSHSQKGDSSRIDVGWPLMTMPRGGIREIRRVPGGGCLRVPRRKCLVPEDWSEPGWAPSIRDI